MPYPNFHAARVRDPGDFASIVVLQTLPNGIMIYGGLLKSDPGGDSKPQAYRFPKEKFTVAQARAWLAEHDIKPILFEPATEQESSENEHEDFASFKTVKNIELWREGNTNDNRKITKKDVQAVYDNTVKAIEDGLTIPLKTGHDDKEEIAKGIIGNLKLKNNNGKLSMYGDYKNVPDVIAELINKKLLGQRSVEIWNDLMLSTGEKIGKVLKAVALLGITTPAEHFLYESEDKDYEIYVDNFEQEVHNKDSRGSDKIPLGNPAYEKNQNNIGKEESMETYTKEQVDSEIKSALAESTEKFKTKVEEFETQIKTLTDTNAENEKKLEEFAKAEAESLAKRNAEYIEEKIKNGRLLPKQKDTALKMYSKIIEEDGEDKAKEEMENYFNAIPEGLMTEVSSTEEEDEKYNAHLAELDLTPEDVKKYADKE